MLFYSYSAVLSIHISTGMEFTFIAEQHLQSYFHFSQFLVNHDTYLLNNTFLNFKLIHNLKVIHTFLRSVTKGSMVLYEIPNSLLTLLVLTMGLCMIASCMFWTVYFCYGRSLRIFMPWSWLIPLQIYWPESQYPLYLGLIL